MMANSSQMGGFTLPPLNAARRLHVTAGATGSLHATRWPGNPFGYAGNRTVVVQGRMYPLRRFPGRNVYYSFCVVNGSVVASMEVRVDGVDFDVTDSSEDIIIDLGGPLNASERG